MSKVIVLSLGQGDLENGFGSVTAKLFADENTLFKRSFSPFGGSPGEHRLLMQLSGSLPPAPEIQQLYQRWQLLYQGISQRLGNSTRLEIVAEDIVQISEVEFTEVCQGLQILLNNWLDSADFRTIDRHLSRELSRTDEIRVII